MHLPYKRRTLCLALSVSSLAPFAAQANDLLDTYHLAQQQDQTLQAAAFQREASVEAYPQARAALLPQVNGTAAENRTRQHTLQTISSSATARADQTLFYNGESWSLNLSQTVFNWAAFQTLAQSHLSVAQAEATYHAAEQSLIYRVADAYFNVLYARDTLKADLDAQAAYKRQYDEAQRKFEVGIVAITDLRNAQASYDSAEATVIADRRALDSANRSLGQLVGRPAAQAVALREEIPLNAPTPSAEEDWVKAAAEDNPSLLSFRYAADAAQKGIAIARSARLPTVSIVGSAGRQIQDLYTGSDAINDSIGLQLNWNIFQGGLVASRTRAAAATYQQSLAQYEGQRRSVDQTTRDAYEGVMSGIASVNAGKQAVISNQTSVEATTVGVRVGTRTEVDLLTAQQALAAAQRTYYKSRYDYLRSVLSLKQAAGRLGEEDLAQVDALLVTP